MKTVDLSETRACRGSVTRSRRRYAGANLAALLLAGSALGDDGVGALCDGLLGASRSALTSLDLSGNAMTPAAAHKLARVLSAESRPLARLDLSGNALGADGAAALATALASNRTLLALSLVGNGLEAEGAAKCAIALKNNRTLASLWLGQNKLGNEGVAAIVDALVAAGPSTHLANLDLSNNNIGAPGIKACVKLLGECGALAALSLAGTKLEFTDTDALQGAANVNAEIGRTKAVRLFMGKEHKNWPRSERASGDAPRRCGVLAGGCPAATEVER